MAGHLWGDRLSRRPLLVDTLIALSLTGLGILYLFILEDVYRADGHEIPLLLGVVLLLDSNRPTTKRRRASNS